MELLDGGLPEAGMPEVVNNRNYHKGKCQKQGKQSESEQEKGGIAKPGIFQESSLKGAVARRNCCKEDYWKKNGQKGRNYQKGRVR